MATAVSIDARSWANTCRMDGEFREAARFWTGALRLEIDGNAVTLCVRDGEPVDTGSVAAEALVVYRGDSATWQRVLADTPVRFHNDLMANASVGAGITVSGNALMNAQYYGAIMRAVELLRPQASGTPLPSLTKPEGSHDAAVGRYVHLTLGGHAHRVYYEEAGQGIPILLQHTAGCHGAQWRHLLENTDITRRFRLIAYDLPMHGKSLPPVTKDWWATPYELRGGFLRSIPVTLARVLGLERPVFMGCSVGGLLALDLAHKHADVFRAVISVEGALRIGGDLDNLSLLYHPQVSNAYKARLMDGLMSPTSPVALRRETSFVYASGWPPAFLGDLVYYVDDYDLRAVAHEIDTSRVAVHILSGEYDYSGRAELGEEAHRAIAGSTWAQMDGVGHFPMSENPEAFLRYLLPILDSID